MLCLVRLGEVDGSESEARGRFLTLNNVKGMACGILAAWTVTAAAAFPVIAANQVQSSNCASIRIVMAKLCVPSQCFFFASLFPQNFDRES